MGSESRVHFRLRHVFLAVKSKNVLIASYVLRLKLGKVVRGTFDL